MQEGSLVRGRYLLLELLGSGGMGRVFRAYDETLDREVALKVLAEHHAPSSEFVARFGREVRSVASLSHPNIVRVFDSGEDDDGLPYMAMELATRGTLKDRIRTEGKIPPREAARIALQVAGALAAAHEAGIVHRDIKPENVLLTDGGDVKVGDFGIARATEATAMTQTSMILGTAPYLSPEQAMGEPVGPASDLYSLGVVLYEALTGRPPFGTGEMNPLAIAMKHLNEPAPSPREPGNSVPPALEGITLTLMRKRPEDRYPSADALAVDLEAFLDGRDPFPVSDPAPTPEARTQILARPLAAGRRRRRKVVPIMAFVLAGLLGLLSLSPGLIQRPVAELTAAPETETLNRATRPQADAPPDLPDAPAKAESDRDEDRPARRETNDAGVPPSAASTSAPTGSASASASASSASASPAPSEEAASAPAQPASPQVPDVPGQVKQPAAGPVPNGGPADVDVDVPEIEVP